MDEYTILSCCNSYVWLHNHIESPKLTKERQNYLKATTTRERNHWQDLVPPLVHYQLELCH